MTPMTWSTPLRSEALGFVLLLAMVGGEANAAAPKESATAEARARRHHAEASTAYDLGRFEDALAGFSEAYRLKPLPGFLFNLGQCQRQLNNPERALFFFKRFLAQSTRPPRNADYVKSLIAQLEQTLAEQQRAPQQRDVPPPAPVVEPVRQADAPRVAPPAMLTPAPPSVAHPATSLAAGEVSPAQDSLLKKWWLWAAVGVVVAGATTAVVYGATAPQPQPRATSLGEVSAQ